MCPACNDGVLPAGWASLTLVPPSIDGMKMRLLMYDDSTQTATLVDGVIKDDQGNAVDLEQIKGWRVRL